MTQQEVGYQGGLHRGGDPRATCKEQACGKPAHEAGRACKRGPVLKHQGPVHESQGLEGGQALVVRASLGISSGPWESIKTLKHSSQFDKTFTFQGLFPCL